MRQWKLGIIGCGSIAKSHAAGVKGVKDRVAFTACCDIREEAARAWAVQFAPNAAIYTDYQDMIRGEELDAIVLATWPNQHREQIERCIESGVQNILSEKTLTVTGQEAYEVWEIVTEADAFLLEGFTYLHHPRMCKLRQILAGADLGTVDSIRAVFNLFDPELEAADDPNRNWRQKVVCAGGVPWDFACYPVNACGWIAADLPTRVYCVGRRSPKYGTIHRMHGIIEYRNGCTGIIESDKQSACQDLQIVLSDAVIDVPDQCWTNQPDAELCIEIRHGLYALDKDVIRCEPGHRFAHQMTHLADVLDGVAQPLLPLVQSVVNMYALDALVTSLQEGRPLHVEIPDDIAREFEREREAKP
jgi:predicted dehydrogenase